MCGIVGAILGEAPETREGRNRLWEAFAGMLIDAEERGCDASGLYVTRRGGETVWAKAPGAASKALREGLYDEMRDIFLATPDVLALIGHTRQATSATAAINQNNHPFADGSIIGVHNGVIWNERALRAAYGAVAATDSAVIFRAMRRASMARGRLDVEGVRASLRTLWGWYAVVVTDRESGATYAARDDSTPLVLARRNQEIWIASQRWYLERRLGSDAKEALKAWVMPANTIVRLGRRNAKGAPLRYHPIRSLPEPLAVSSFTNFEKED